MTISTINNHHSVIITSKNARTGPKKINTINETVKSAGKVIVAGLSVAGGFASSPLVALATGTASNISNGVNNSTHNLTSVKNIQQQSQQFNMDFLKLQMEIQAENRRYTTLSNIQKAKHDTAKAAINNIRS